MKNLKRVCTVKKLLLFALCGVILFSCRDREQGKIAKVKAEKISVSGDLGDYLEVVAGEYEISDDWGGKLSIKVKSKAKASNELLKDKDIMIKLSLLGDNGMPVSGAEDFSLDYASIEKVKSLLLQKSKEEVLLFKGGFGYDADKDADRVKTFTVSSSLTEVPSVSNNTINESTTENVESTTENVANDSDGQNWNKLLDDYEAYVDEYVKFYKKAKDGDQNALAEYPSMMEKAINLQSSLKKAQDDKSLSTTQMTRMAKIQMKMVMSMK